MTTCCLCREETPRELSHEEAVDTDQQNHLPRRTSGTPVICQGGHLAPRVKPAFALDHSRVYKLCLQNILQSVYILKLLQSYVRDLGGITECTEAPSSISAVGERKNKLRYLVSKIRKPHSHADNGC